MRYNPALDGIRALAVLAVVACHARVPGMQAGMWGVDVFFVLSGFLITTLLKNEAEQGGIRFGQFYIRRLRRLYPALLTMLALYLAIFPWFTQAHHFRDALAAALYLTDYTTSLLRYTPWETDLAIGHTWSLSVEEHFYLIWPVVIAGLAKVKTRRFVLYILAAAYLSSTVWRLWSHVNIGWWETYSRFDARTSGLILGSALAFLPELRHRAWALAVIPLAWATWAMTRPGHLLDATPTIAAEWMGAALVLWAMSGRAKVLQARPLTYVGRMSYGIYLYHYPVLVALTHWDAYWWQVLAITVLVSFPLAHYSLLYIENRFRHPSPKKAVSYPGMQQSAA